MSVSVMAASPATAAPDAQTVVELATPADAAMWDAFVASRPEAHGYHEWAWRDVIERSFGHRGAYLIARAAGAVTGVLPLVEMKSPLFGHFLTSLPFVNYAGVLADSRAAAEALVAAAGDLGRARGCRHVELRHIDRRFPDMPVRQHKVTMRLPLAAGMWERFDRKVRNQIRKAEKSGLTAERGDSRLLPEFYAVFARNMRDLGTPVYGRRLFEGVLAAFGGRARIVVVRREGHAIAAALTYRTRLVTEVPWASSLRDFNPLCPNHLMYWRAIEWAIEDGCTTFDFGRSTPHEGTYNFKSQWGAEPTALHWEYPHLVGGRVPDQGPTNPKFEYAIAAWRRMPLWLSNTVGPYIARAIP
jgi:FemAB-related protein (PEP-CTERM system-associated)